MIKDYEISEDILKTNIDEAVSKSRAQTLERNIPSLDKMQAVYVLKVYKKSGFNATRTARILGISRSTFYRLLNHWKVAGYVKRNDY